MRSTVRTHMQIYHADIMRIYYADALTTAGRAGLHDGDELRLCRDRNRADLV